jgi:hypothetical protein
LDGGADRNRTCDLLIANETLYQLSYDPIHLQKNHSFVPKLQAMFWKRAIFHCSAPEFGLFSVPGKVEEASEASSHPGFNAVRNLVFSEFRTGRREK